MTEEVNAASNQQDASSLRDRIRAKTVGSRHTFVRKIIYYHPPVYSEKSVYDHGTGQYYTFVEIEGYEDPVAVEVRQPSVKERNQVVSKYRNSETMDMDLILWMAINQTFVPGTDEPVFTKEDYDALVNSPAGGFADQFGNQALELLNVDTDAAGKGSEETRSSGQS